MGRWSELLVGREAVRQTGREAEWTARRGRAGCAGGDLQSPTLRLFANGAPKEHVSPYTMIGLEVCCCIIAVGFDIRRSRHAARPVLQRPRALRTPRSLVRAQAIMMPMMTGRDPSPAKSKSHSGARPRRNDNCTTQRDRSPRKRRPRT